MEVPFFPTLFSCIKDSVVQQALFSTLEDWLVKHPKILQFSWENGQTPASSHRFLTLTVLSYISFTFVLSQLSRPSLSRPLLKSIAAVHNIFLLTLSFIMALGCLVSIFSQRIHEEAILPSRLPSLHGGHHVLYLLRQCSVLRTHGADHQLRGACRNVHLLPVVHPGDAPQVEENGDGFSTSAVLVKLFDHGHACVLPLHCFWLLWDSELVFQCSLHRLSSLLVLRLSCQELLHQCQGLQG
ncbi:hypothetical protein Godav_025671 [Gossypium davidsonii]|uniref:Uncharacterized protein n=1 Tax=Gossypium davidsonii TaxID=34287 RepID=A0A7J8T8P9_GOSDV|nr:hypothetical protein [Gossypium davidsonii]